MAGLLALALIALAAQHRRNAARFVLFDADPADAPAARLFAQLAAAIPHEITVATNASAAAVLNELTEELEQRSGRDAASAPSTYLLLRDLQKFKPLRYEEDFGFAATDASPAAGRQLDRLICEGPSLGFHVLCSCDTVNNLNRWLSRKALSEFERRVLFQMSANDSAFLMDSPRANELGLYRALLFNQQEGTQEIFRPYGLPRPEWLAHATRQVARLLTGGGG